LNTRRLARDAAASRPASWLVAALERLDPGRSNILPVLTYHRIAEPPGRDVPAALFVPPAEFEEQLDVLTRRYEPVGIEMLLDVRHGRARMPRRAILFTFDDAYVDFGTTAWPMLRARSIPAILFVPTAYPDQPQRWFWWESLAELVGTTSAPRIVTPVGDLPLGTRDERSRAHRALRDHCKRIGVDESVALVEQLAEQVGAPPSQNGVLGWDALRDLVADGVTIAPHSRTHALLTQIPDEQLADELTGSRADVVRELGTTPPCFAYPSGDWDQRVVDATAAAGYEVAFTTRRGVNDLRRPAWLSMRRVNVGHGTDATMIRGQIGSWMSLGRRG
jgi:peptidoglycan/xylan/chitin deacetylase (PgdA/CDA1 family)